MPNGHTPENKLATPRGNQFHIDRVRLRHYRSIAGCDVALGQMVLLVGANGSGKSNFLDSLRLVSDALQTTLDYALRGRGGIAEVRRRATGHPTHFGIRLHFSYGQVRGEYGFQVAAVKGGDFRVSHEDCYLSGLGRTTEGTLLPDEARFAVRDGQLVDTSETVMPTPSVTDRLYLVSASGVPVFRDVFNGLSGINIYNLNPEAMRSLQTPDTGDILRRDGSNIGSVLARLRRENPAIKERIEEYLQRITEGIIWVDKKGLGNYETVEFGQTVSGAKSPWAFQATSISDGTLRALGVLTALFAGSEYLLSPIGIEEPESALHPAAAGLLLEALRDASSRRQVFATSHSPDLLDSRSISPEELLAVTLIDGQTKIGPIDSAARFALEQSLYTPGELLRVDQIQPEETPARQMELFT